MSHKDFLVELGTEELPPKALKNLAESFRDGIVKGLDTAGLAHGEVKFYAAPRRLAVFVGALATQQPDRTVTVDGPPVKAAFDANGEPTQAALGFARKNGADISELDRSGEKLRFVREVKGEAATLLLPGIVAQSLNDLPIPKRMRWGASRVEFVRPTQWLVMLLGRDVVECEILAQKAGRDSRGHRFHHPEPVHIFTPASYVDNLRTAHVIADFAERRESILKKVQRLAEMEQGSALIPEALLEEVTSLVEWPVPLVCSFEERFLGVPQEALISTMQDNQKYFCLLDADGKLLPRFITVANVDSPHPEYIVAGNEKVVRPRLTDAEFFFNQDKKSRLETRNERLRNVVFQAQLGTVYEKVERVSLLASAIADASGGGKERGARAGLLSKCDLATEMVSEFPELQGIAGYYYATHDGEDAEVARALIEQYQPRFAGDELPSTLTGAALSVADKIDTLVGIFGINQPPTGSKDPFALRRSAIGLLRIMIAKEMALDIKALAFGAAKLYEGKLTSETVVSDVFEFLLGRYRAMYEEQGVKTEVILAVQALQPVQPVDFDRRIKAVAHFATLPEAEALAAANKRVSNILAKESVPTDALVDAALLSEPAETALAEAVARLEAELAPLFEARDYTPALGQLAALRPQIDDFFDKVMVMAEDAAVRMNRLVLLARLRSLFLKIADVSLLQA
jgi:glycyl-tRNA synthetase beta chain